MNTWQDIDNAERAEGITARTLVDFREHAHWLAAEAQSAGQHADFYKLRAWGHAAQALFTVSRPERDWLQSRVDACLRNAEQS